MHSNVRWCWEEFNSTSKIHGYRVMEEMADRVPGVNYKESRTLSADDAMGVGGRHIEISFADPDLDGWMRANDVIVGKILTLLEDSLHQFLVLARELIYADRVLVDDD